MGLDKAREELLMAVANGGTVDCPCCYQTAKMYSRLIDSRMAAGLIAVYKHEDEWVHIPTLANETLKLGNQLGGVLAKLRYWGLLEEEKRRRKDGGRAGFWTITDKGVEFVERRVKVKKYAKIYNNRVIELHGDEITIDDALGEKFDYEALMKPAQSPIAQLEIF